MKRGDFVLLTPPLSTYIDRMPVSRVVIRCKDKDMISRSSFLRVKQNQRCANPECDEFLTENQIRKGFKYHNRECGKSVAKNKNAMIGRS